MSDPTYDNQTITQYLLGMLPAAETEQLDELSFTSETFAESLGVTEKDLIDAYVQGELSGESLARFKSYYLASPLRREKVAFARALITLGDTSAVTTGTRSSLFQSLFQLPRLTWALTAAAFLVLIIAGWIIFQKSRLKVPVNRPEEAALTNTPTPLPTVPPSTGLEEKPTLVAEINDGDAVITLDHEGKLSGAEKLPPAYQLMVKQALSTQRLEKPALLEGLSRPSSSLMGSDDQGNKFSVNDPVGKVVLSDRPTFRWSKLGGATGYVVEVYDEKFDLAGASSQLVDNSWTPSLPLKRGGVYSWQVKAFKDGQEFKSPRPPAPQAKFRVLDQARASELARARRTNASSHLTLALLYAQAGLLDDAERELHLLQKTNANSAIVGHLLASLQSMRR